MCVCVYVCTSVCCLKCSLWFTCILSLLLGKIQEYLLQCCLIYWIILDIHCRAIALHKSKEFRPFYSFQWNVKRQHTMMLLSRVHENNKYNLFTILLCQESAYFKIACGNFANTNSWTFRLFSLWPSASRLLQKQQYQKCILYYIHMQYNIYPYICTLGYSCSLAFECWSHALCF